MKHVFVAALITMRTASSKRTAASARRAGNFSKAGWIVTWRGSESTQTEHFTASERTPSSRMLPRVVNGREEGHGSTGEPLPPSLFSVLPRIDEDADAARSFAVNRNATRRTAGRDFHAAEPNTARRIAPEGSTGRDRNSARPRCFRQLGSRRCPKADGEHDAH